MLEQVEEKLSTSANVHHEEEFVRALEGPVQLYQEGVVQLL